MSDAGWAALASMVTAICSLLAAIYARQAKEQSRENKAAIDEHEDASAERGRILRASLAPGGEGPPAPEGAPGAPGAVLDGVDGRLLSFAHRNGLHITSGREGRHNIGSKHYSGKAIDFRTRGLSEEFWQHLERDALEHGLKLRDERLRPHGQKVWGGPHAHLETLD